MSEANKIYLEAKYNLEKEDFQEGFKYIQNGLGMDAGFREFYELAAEALDWLGDEEEATLFKNALNNFDNYKPFFDLGYHFVEIGNWKLAESMLRRANSLNPLDCDVAYEYSLALGATFQFEKALEVLKKTNYFSDFWTSYRVYFFEILLNQDINKAKEFIRYIRTEIYKQESLTEEDTFALYKLSHLQEMTQRIQAIGVPTFHVRDYHFIQYGGALMTFTDDWGGRSIELWLSPQEVRDIAENIKNILNVNGISTRNLLYLPDRNTSILACILGEILNVKISLFEERMPIPENTIIMASSALSFSSFRSLSVMQPTVKTLAFYLDWTKDGACFCPDIGGVLTQSCHFPWEEGVKFLNSRNVEKYPADSRNKEKIAKEIAALAPSLSTVDNFATHLEFYQKYASFLKLNQSKGTRHLFTRESPVSGNRS